MGLPELYWLPEAERFAERLAVAKAGDDPAAALAALRGLAGHRLGFIETARLDRAVQAVLPRIEPDAAGPRVRLALVAATTVDHLVPAIRVGCLRRGLIADIYVAPLAQHRQELIDPGSGLHRFDPEVVLLMPDAASLLPALPLTTPAEAVSAALDDCMVQLRAAWRAAQDRLGAAVIQQTATGRDLPLFGSFERRVPASRPSMTRALNERLWQEAAAAGIQILDLDWWALQAGGRTLGDPLLWHHAKQAIAPAHAPLFGDVAARQIAALRGLSRKCLVLDLDNTLWGGVIGDDGPAGIRLGQGSAVGEAYAGFQAYLKRLGERGVALAVSSKNEPETARSVFREHPEMILRLDDIAAFEAGWGDKPAAIRRIAEDLNLGLDALVFFDDNPAERMLVRQTLPMVAVPEVPDAPELYAASLADAGWFEAVAFTADDARRTGRYAANGRRREAERSATDLDAFLCALETEIVAFPFDAPNLPRIVQLINKTNQFNLTTRRYTEAEVRALMACPTVVTLAARVRDRFGDNGIVSAIIARPAGPGDRSRLEIDTWLMSCRVFGRRIEHSLLSLLIERARARGAATLIGRYRPSPKNGLVRDHYRNLGFAPANGPDAAEGGDTCWTLPLHGPDPVLPPTFARVIAQ